MYKRQNENSIYDIQIKRLHEYKRQQLNALYIISKYLEIKGGKKPSQPVTFIFGAKAAPAYVIAKDIIHLPVSYTHQMCIRDRQSYDQSILVYSIQPLSVFWTALLLLQDPAKQTQDLLSLIHI